MGKKQVLAITTENERVAVRRVEEKKGYSSSVCEGERDCREATK